MLIIWDRLFSNYVAEGPKMLHDFGLIGFDADAPSPVGIAFHEWRRMLGRRAPAAASAPPAE